MKILLFFAFSFFALTLQAEVKICAHCGKGSRSMRYSAEGKHYCSMKCSKAKVSCFNCGQVPRGRYMISMGINGESRRFCDRCSQFRKCFSCSFPAESIKVFPDGRVQCTACSRKVFSFEETEKLVKQIRFDLKKMYGYDTQHRITLRLVNKNVLRNITKSEDVMGCMKTLVNTETKIRGLKKTETKKWQCTLYLLDHLPPVAAAKVIAHELTHDHLYHRAGAGKDPKITEGICEAVSAKWLQSYGYHGYVKAMQKNPDPIYGAGFREMYPQLERYGMRGIIERYRSCFTPF